MARSPSRARGTGRKISPERVGGKRAKPDETRSLDPRHHHHRTGGLKINRESARESLSRWSESKDRQQRWKEPPARRGECAKPDESKRPKSRTRRHSPKIRYRERAQKPHLPAPQTTNTSFPHRERSSAYTLQWVVSSPSGKFSFAFSCYLSYPSYITCSLPGLFLFHPEPR